MFFPSRMELELCTTTLAVIVLFKTLFRKITVSGVCMCVHVDKEIRKSASLHSSCDGSSAGIISLQRSPWGSYAATYKIKTYLQL